MGAEGPGNPVTILLRFLPHLIGLGLLVAGWLWLNHACWSSACKSERTQNENLRTQIGNAQKRATDLALLYAQTAEKADDDLRKERATRVQQASELRRRAGNLDRTPTISVGPDAARLLRDSADLANAAPAPIRDQTPAVAVPGTTFSEAELVSKWADAALAYADARGQWLACVNFYERLQNESARAVE